MQGKLIELRLQAIRYEAQGICSFVLRPPQGGEVPAFTAGAHIDLHLPNGLIRSYSLANAPAEKHRYVIAVNRDVISRGGSSYVHDSLKVGNVLTASEPRNNFRLVEDAAHSVFIAGGIGITPIRSMISRLEALGRSWELFYCTRARQATAYLEELRGNGEHVKTNLHFTFSDEGAQLDIRRLLREASRDTHFYCCGPVSMLRAFEEATSGIAADRAHVEYFAANEQAAAEGGFQVELAGAQRIIAVPKGKTILDALLDAGVDVPHSCMEGVCASCETRVLGGVPDHRDLVLSKEEQAANDRMMICCSGSKS